MLQDFLIMRIVHVLLVVVYWTYCFPTLHSAILLRILNLDTFLIFLPLLYNVTLQPQVHASEVCCHSTIEICAHRQQASPHVLDFSFAIGIVDNRPIIILKLQQWLIMSTSNNNRSASIIIWGSKVFLAMVASYYVLYMETDPFEEEEDKSK